MSSPAAPGNPVVRALKDLEEQDRRERVAGGNGLRRKPGRILEGSESLDGTRVTDSSYGLEVLTDSSYGLELLTDSSYGLELLTDSSYGLEVLTDSSYGLEVLNYTQLNCTQLNHTQLNHTQLNHTQLNYTMSTSNHADPQSTDGKGPGPSTCVRVPIHKVWIIAFVPTPSGKVHIMLAQHAGIDADEYAFISGTSIVGVDRYRELSLDAKGDCMRREAAREMREETGIGSIDFHDNRKVTEYHYRYRVPNADNADKRAVAHMYLHHRVYFVDIGETMFEALGMRPSRFYKSTQTDVGNAMRRFESLVNDNPARDGEVNHVRFFEVSEVLRMVDASLCLGRSIVKPKAQPQAQPQARAWSSSRKGSQTTDEDGWTSSSTKQKRAGRPWVLWYEQARFVVRKPMFRAFFEQKLPCMRSCRHWFNSPISSRSHGSSPAPRHESFTDVSYDRTVL
jgi:hypothetical protein